MNVSLNLSPGQLSKLRNGHGIRIMPKMVGSGVDIIIDPMTFHNLSKKLNKGKGAVFKMGPAEINMNKMEGSGLFAGAGNKSGKINRFKKAEKWRDFAGDTVDRGLDLGKKGLSLYQQATSPMKRLFGGEMDMEGGNLFTDAKNAYNKNVKNTAVGKAIRNTARQGLSLGYDAGTKLLDKSKYTKPIATIGRNQKGAVIDKAMKLSGLGLKLSGDGMRLSGGRCCGCGMSYNDQFLFGNQAL
jgi:hypothetical protein